MRDALYHLIENECLLADKRFGPPTSTHEAIGVALEEWHELIDAVRANDLPLVRDECIDLIAILVRLAEACSVEGGEFERRSVK
jgi:NTP pyrophosphatase (non-canonical NTP hydrolase)